MIVTLEQARAALTTKIEALKASWTDYPLVVEYYNTNIVNPSNQSKPYLSVNMMLVDGHQTSLGPNSGHRVMGTIKIEARVKEGSGSAQANKLLEFFYPAIHMTDTIPPLRTYAASFSSGQPAQGWVGQAANIPFWYDSIPP